MALVGVAEWWLLVARLDGDMAADCCGRWGVVAAVFVELSATAGSLCLKRENMPVFDGDAAFVGESIVSDVEVAVDL